MIFVRITVWLIYFFICIKIDDSIKNKLKINFKTFKPVLRFSIWISIANVIGPIISYSDRIIIGGVISTAALTYYSTPYEIVTKLLLIPGALVGVLFPLFSASFTSIPDKAIDLFAKGVKYIFLIIYPLVFFIVAFSFEGMHLWLGEAFAQKSSTVMQFLSIGILMNSLSLIPNTFFQGTGKPQVPTLLNLAELPIYIFGMWFMISNYELEGAAFFYMIAATFDALIMYYLANKSFGVKFKTVFSATFFIAFILLLFLFMTIQLLLLKIVLSLILLSTFIFCVWQFFLSIEEKRIFISRIKLLNLKS